MPAVMLTAPEAEPIGLADAKAYLRLDHDAEDPLVQDLIAAAARQVEKLTRRVLIAQRWRLDVRLPCGEAIPLRPRPVRDVEAVRLRRPDGGFETLPTDAWSFDWAGERLILLRPPPGRGTLEIELACGYGDPEDVPESLLLAMRRLVADGYERRSPAEGPPADVAALLAPYRDVSL